MSERAEFDEGLAAFERGDLVAARQVFEQFVSLYPRSELADNALYQLGMVHSLEGRKDEALAVFQRCMEGYAGTDAAPLAAARAREIEEADHGDDERRARELFHRGQNLASRRSFREAKEALRECVDKYPDSSLADNAYLHLSTVLSIEGDFREARKVLRTILERFPDSDAASLVPTALKRIELDEQA